MFLVKLCWTYFFFWGGGEGECCAQARREGVHSLQSFSLLQYCSLNDFPAWTRPYVVSLSLPSAEFSISCLTIVYFYLVICHHSATRLIGPLHFTHRRPQIFSSKGRYCPKKCSKIPKYNRNPI